MTAVVTHDPLGHSRRARGVENVEGVCGGNRDAGSGFRRAHRFPPIMVTPRNQACSCLESLQDETGFGLELCQFDRSIQQRLAATLDVRSDAAPNVRLLGSAGADPGELEPSC